MADDKDTKKDTPAEKPRKKRDSIKPKRIVGLRDVNPCAGKYVPGIGKVDALTGEVEGFARWRDQCRVTREGRTATVFAPVGGEYRQPIAYLPDDGRAEDDALIEAGIRHWDRSNGTLELIEE